MDEITVTITPAQARWLKAAMQNPFLNEFSEDEIEIDSQMRRVFWDKLKDVNAETAYPYCRRIY